MLTMPLPGRGDPRQGAWHSPSDAGGGGHLQCEALDCPGCGRANRDGARFCDSCGGALTVVEPSTPRTVGDGRYEVGDRLGEGARKVVYRGTDSRLGRDVAVALIKTDGLDAHGRARVQREARAMARLGDHPHVVAVLDAGEEDGRPFIVSQLLTGGSLEDRLATADACPGGRRRRPDRPPGRRGPGQRPRAGRGPPGREAGQHLVRRRRQRPARRLRPGPGGRRGPADHRGHDRGHGVVPGARGRRGPGCRRPQ